MNGFLFEFINMSTMSKFSAASKLSEHAFAITNNASEILNSKNDPQRSMSSKNGLSQYKMVSNTKFADSKFSQARINEDVIELNKLNRKSNNGDCCGDEQPGNSLSRAFQGAKHHRGVLTDAEGKQLHQRHAKRREQEMALERRENWHLKKLRKEKVAANANAKTLPKPSEEQKLPPMPKKGGRPPVTAPMGARRVPSAGIAVTPNSRTAAHQRNVSGGCRRDHEKKRPTTITRNQPMDIIPSTSEVASERNLTSAVDSPQKQADLEQNRTDYVEGKISQNAYRDKVDKLKNPDEDANNSKFPSLSKAQQKLMKHKQSNSRLIIKEEREQQPASMYLTSCEANMEDMERNRKNHDKKRDEYRKELDAMEHELRSKVMENKEFAEQNVVVDPDATLDFVVQDSPPVSEGELGDKFEGDEDSDKGYDLAGDSDSDEEVEKSVPTLGEPHNKNLYQKRTDFSKFEWRSMDGKLDMLRGSGDFIGMRVKQFKDKMRKVNSFMKAMEDDSADEGDD